MWLCWKSSKIKQKFSLLWNCEYCNPVDFFFFLFFSVGLFCFSRRCLVWMFFVHLYFWSFYRMIVFFSWRIYFQNYSDFSANISDFFFMDGCTFFSSFWNPCIAVLDMHKPDIFTFYNYILNYITEDFELTVIYGHLIFFLLTFLLNPWNWYSALTYENTFCCLFIFMFVCLFVCLYFALYIICCIGKPKNTNFEGSNH